MKSNKIVFATLAIGLFWLASCKKTDTTNHTADPNAKQHNEDVSNTKNESDNLNNDINSVIKDSGFGKTEGGQATICGATIENHNNVTPPYVIIDFNGTFCGNPSRKREGRVIVTLVSGTHWSQQNAKLKVDHQNYKVTFANLNNHYVTFNGTKYLTNISGLHFDILAGSSTDTITERSDNMKVTFENGQEANWNSARRSSWSATGLYTISPKILATVEGDSIDNNGKKIDSWGTTRFGTHFTTEMNTPWMSGTDCGWWKPTQGKYTSTTDNFFVSATFGVNQDGTSHGSGCGAYGIKLEWNYNSGQATGNAVIPYF